MESDSEWLVWLCGGLAIVFGLVDAWLAARSQTDPIDNDGTGL